MPRQIDSKLASIPPPGSVPRRRAAAGVSTGYHLRRAALIGALSVVLITQRHTVALERERRSEARRDEYRRSPLNS